MVSLAFTHASDYVIAIGESKEKESNSVTELVQQETSDKDGTGEEENPQTRQACAKSALLDDRFRCMGGTDAKYFIADFAVDQKAYKVMDACRGTKDCVGILLYGIQGVCHQMANRFIFPVTGRHMKRNNKHPKGYIISTSVYGLKGTWYTTWYATKVLPAMKKFKAESMSQEDMDVVAYDIEKELEGLQKDIASLFEEVGINVPADSIWDAQKEWLLRRGEIMKKYNILAADGSMVESV